MRIKEGFVLEKVGDGYLAVAVGGRADSFSGLVRLNSTGAFLWNNLAEGGQLGRYGLCGGMHHGILWRSALD